MQYQIEDLINRARELFGVSPALVKVALTATGKKKFTLKDAKRIVKEFAAQEV